MNIRNRVAVVTGAASGIGLATAKELVKRGARVLFVDMNPDVETEAARMGQHSYVGNLTDRDVRRGMIQAAEFHYGEPPTIGAFAAGITRDGYAIRMSKGAPEAVLFDEADWDSVMEVNLKAPIFSALELVKRLVETGRVDPRNDGDENGALAFLGSISSEGNAGQLNYAASKGALIATTVTLLLEWRKRWGIRPLIIHPGFTRTQMTLGMPEKVLSAQLANTQSGLFHPAENVAIEICDAIEDGVTINKFLDRFNHALLPELAQAV